MKNLKTKILLLFIITGTQNLHAQVQNTSWKGVFNVPSPQECVFEFKTDSVYLTTYGSVLETSTFKVIGDTLMLQKFSGSSPCGTDIIGIYHFEIKDDKLLVTVIEDACEPRARSLPQEQLTAVKK